MVMLNEREFMARIEQVLRSKAQAAVGRQRDLSVGRIAGGDLSLTHPVVVLLLGDSAIRVADRLHRELQYKVGNNEAIVTVTIGNDVLAELRECSPANADGILLLNGAFWEKCLVEAQTAYEETLRQGRRHAAINLRQMNLAVAVNACDFGHSAKELGYIYALFRHLFFRQFITVHNDLFVLMNERDIANPASSHLLMSGISELHREEWQADIALAAEPEEPFRHYGRMLDYAYVLGERDMLGLPVQAGDQAAMMARMIVLSNIESGIRRQNISLSAGRNRSNLVGVAYSGISSPIDGLYYYGLSYFAGKLFDMLTSRGGKAAAATEATLRLNELDHLIANPAAEAIFYLPNQYHHRFDIAHAGTLHEAEQQVYGNDLASCLSRWLQEKDTAYIGQAAAGIREALRKGVLGRVEHGFVFAILSLNQPIERPDGTETSPLDRLQYELNRTRSRIDDLEDDIREAYNEDIYKKLSRERSGWFVSARKKQEKMELRLRSHLIEHVYRKRLEIHRLRDRDRLLTALSELCREEGELAEGIIGRIGKVKEIIRIACNESIRDLRSIFVNQLESLCENKIDAIMQRNSMFSSVQSLFSPGLIGALSEAGAIDVERLFGQIVEVYENGIINNLIQELGSFDSILQMEAFRSGRQRTQVLEHIKEKARASLIYNNYLSDSFFPEPDREFKYMIGNASGDLFRHLHDDQTGWQSVDHRNTIDVELIKLINGFEPDDLILYRNRRG